MSKKAINEINKNEFINPKTIIGYLIFDINTKKYLDENDYVADTIEEAFIFNNFEEAKDNIEEDRDSANDYEIHEFKITYELQKEIERKVVYESKVISE